MNTNHLIRCDGATRRDFVRVGVLGAMGLGLTDLLRRPSFTAESQRSEPRARNCILIWLDGGPSHLDTWDPKPHAPAEIRGPFQTIQTALPGVQLSELMPRTASLLSKVAIVRSMTSTLGEHNFGAHYLLTGYKPTPAVVYPAFGSVVAHVRDPQHTLPSNIAIPHFRVGGGKFTGSGFLPATTGPFEVGGDPAKPGFRVRDLDAYKGVTGPRLDQRRSYLAALDGLSSRLDAGQTAPTDPVFEQAFRLLASSDARAAFDLDQEPDSVRKSYGGRTIGQSCLLARRLVERGVPFVTVNNPGWDTHQDQYTRLKEGYTGARIPVGLAPSMDLAFSTLVNDLDDRGLLDETLIVVMGEFGRTPKLNTSGGRDHWPRAFSVMLAGGGVPGGQIIGESDASGESPADRPVTPADLAATIYTLLEIDPAHKLHTADGRPIQINRDGSVIAELVG